MPNCIDDLLQPSVFYYESQKSEPMGRLLENFWPKQLINEQMDPNSVENLQEGVRLDKFLSIVSQSESFMNNSVLRREEMRDLIYRWLYARTVTTGHGDFQAGYTQALPFRWVVLPTCHQGEIIIRAKDNTVNVGGDMIRGKLKTWQMNEVDWTGSIDLHGGTKSYTFTWDDIEKELVELPDWPHLIGAVLEAGSKKAGAN